MNIDEAIAYADFLQRQTLHLSRRPRNANGKLLRGEDLAMAKTLYQMVDEHEQVCRRFLSHE